MMRNVVIVLLSLFTALSASAVSFSYLKGSGFRDDKGYRPTKETLTIENFSMWEYGSVFFYYDITEPRTQDNANNNSKGYTSNQFFGGISPTFSLSKMTGKNISAGFVKDVSIRLEWEQGSGSGVYNFQNYFYGLQYDLAIPGFDFFSLNTVLRDSPLAHGVGVQIGMFWQMTHEFHQKARFKFTGFLAASPWDGNSNPSATGNPGTDGKGRFLTTQPQLLYDLGYALWGKQNRLETGIEYAYFLNRFQVAHHDEKVIQYMVKSSF